MTNEQHIANLKKLKSFHNGSYGADIDRAIKALEQEPCEDAISRQVIKEQMIKYGFHAPDMTVTEFVEDLPPVNPQEPKIVPIAEIKFDDDMLREIVEDAVKNIEIEPKTGRWIVHEIEGTLKWLECSNCHCETSYNVMHNYCPNCGAKMVEPQETETWNGYHGQITVPKGTFEKIYEDAESEDKE